MLSAVAAAALFAAPSVASAQGFGVGGRLSWVKANSNADLDSVRFTGGQIRALSGRWGVEVSLDHHSESFELANQKVSETPIQASLLLRTGGSKASVFLLGGPGWYRRKVELINTVDDLDVDVKTTEFGWHAGVGLEVLPSRHVGIHGDYRFTFLDFDGDDEDDGGGIGGVIGRFLPGHRGSMLTLGMTVYF